MALLEHHIAVVTGAASGIGRAIAAGYAREGAQVALLDSNEDAVAEAARLAQRATTSGGGRSCGATTAPAASWCDRRSTRWPSSGSAAGDREAR